MKRYGLPLPMEEITDQTPQNLTEKLSSHWEELLKLLESLDTETRTLAHQHIRQITSISRELKVRQGVELLRNAHERHALRGHANRLNGFMGRLLVICVENQVSRARPVCESAEEYLEAWNSRNQPTDAEFRLRLEKQLHNCSSNPNR